MLIHHDLLSCRGPSLTCQRRPTRCRPFWDPSGSRNSTWSSPTAHGPAAPGASRPRRLPCLAGVRAASPAGESLVPPEPGEVRLTCLAIRLRAEQDDRVVVVRHGHYRVRSGGPAAAEAFDLSSRTTRSSFCTPNSIIGVNAGRTPERACPRRQAAARWRRTRSRRDSPRRRRRRPGRTGAPMGPRGRGRPRRRPPCR